MEASSILFLFSLCSLLFQLSHSKSVIVSSLAEWKNPNVIVGDTVIFKLGKHYTLYIFQNSRAFKLCNFSQATTLANPTADSYTWYPSRPGFFYFSFNNGTPKVCDKIEKVSVKVSARTPESSTPSPEASPEAAPTPESGGIISSSPVYHGPTVSPQANSPGPGPGQAPSAVKIPATVPPILPDTGGGIPFINSNPAVPLPTGQADAATIRPLPTSGHRQQVVGLVAAQIPLYVAWMVLY